MDEHCGNCKFCFEGPDKKLECHRFPPSIFTKSRIPNSDGVERIFSISGWPEVLDDEWCGEYKEQKDDNLDL
jgi:hypothetical protein